MSSISAVTATSNGLLTFQRNRTTRLPSATRAVNQSPMAIFPSKTHAPRMVPMAAALAPLMTSSRMGMRCLVVSASITTSEMMWRAGSVTFD